MMKMKKSAEKTIKAAAAVRPASVSKKFYAEVEARIVAAVGAIGGCESDVRVLMSAVDAYLTDGCVPAEDSAANVRMVFMLLRSELDKAMKRSQKARERAKSVKSGQNTEANVAEITPKPVDEPASTPTQTQIASIPKTEKKRSRGRIKMVPLNRLNCRNASGSRRAS